MKIKTRFSTLRSFAILTVFVSLGLSCSRSKKTEGELDIVINHFSRYPQDSLKLKAAKFLIENMDGLRTLDSVSMSENQVYFDVLDSIYKSRGVEKNISSTDAMKAIDSLSELKQLQEPPYPVYNDEKKVVKARFLIQNIDDAFHAWRTMPWSKPVSFEDFCEYILPYRCIDTYSTNARRYFLSKYSKLIASLKQTENCFQVADSINKDVNMWFSENFNMNIRYPNLSPITFSNLMKYRFGTCLQTNALKVTVLRSLGIPVALDGIPNWGNNNSAHYGYKIIDPAHDTVKTFITNKNIDVKTQHIFSASSYDELPYTGLPDYAQLNYNRSIPKIYRSCFSRQKNSLAVIKAPNDEVPAYFRNDRLKDVTTLYLKTASVKVKLNKAYDHKFVYLCVFDNESWIPVAWAHAKDGSAQFAQMGKSIVYLPQYYSNGVYSPAGPPFLLKDDGSMQVIRPISQGEKVSLHAKFPCRTYVLRRMSYFVGGRFQLANRADLSDSTNIVNFEKLPYYETEIKVPIQKKFRYAAYQFKNVPVTYISELAVYGFNGSGKEEKLEGKLIGHPGMYPNTSDKISDNDRNTVFSSKITGGMNPSLIKEVSPITYIGFDFGRPRAISRIVFSPTTDDNAVQTGESYLLYYWNDKWIPVNLKKKLALSNTIDYNNVPKGALLLLKDARGGKEQRIFLYKDGRQEFW